MATKRLLEILWPGLLIYIQEVFWVGNQGEGTSPCCTLFFSDFRTSFSFSLWLGGWDHFTRRTETFQKISNMYGYLFVHITLHGFFCEFSVVRGGGNDETVSTGCGSPSVLHPWMLLLHMQETALWIPPVCCVLDDICKRQLCGFPQWGLLSSRGGGPDTLAQTHWHQSYSLKDLLRSKWSDIIYNSLANRRSNTERLISNCVLCLLMSACLQVNDLECVCILIRCFSALRVFIVLWV